MSARARRRLPCTVPTGRIGLWVQAALTLSFGIVLLLLTGCRREAAPVKASAPTLPTIQFTDVTERAGLSFVQSDGDGGMHYFVQQVAAGAALLDANGDGLLDIYFPQPKPLGTYAPQEPLRQRLYLNTGEGRFKLAANAFGGHDTDYGIGAAVGDYDNDGDPDLYVACAGRNTLYRNRGDGSFEDVTVQSATGLEGFSSGAVWFDYDQDGFLDLFVTRYCEWTVETDIPCPGPNGGRTACHPTTYPPAACVLYRNQGDGTFRDVTRTAGLSRERRRSLGAAAADFDGDGRLDLFVANDIGANFLYQNRGDGTFEDVALMRNVAFGLNGQSQANMGVGVGDYDADSDMDVLITTFSGEPYTLYRNEGAYFTDVSATSGIARPTLPFLSFGTGFLDAANRGMLDAFFANGHVSPTAYLLNKQHTYKQRNQFFVNTGDGRFVEAPQALPTDNVRVHRGACFGDVDNDGRVDILVTATNDRPTLLKNESDAGNWLSLRLTDARGSVTPIGTRCVATANGRQLTRIVLGGGSYAGESDHRVHFGLGAATHADVEIRWPDGRVQTVKGIAANHIHGIRQDAPGLRSRPRR